MQKCYSRVGAYIYQIKGEGFMECAGLMGGGGGGGGLLEGGGLINALRYIGLLFHLWIIQFPKLFFYQAEYYYLGLSWVLLPRVKLSTITQGLVEYYYPGFSWVLLPRVKLSTIT